MFSPSAHGAQPGKRGAADARQILHALELMIGPDPGAVHGFVALKLKGQYSEAQDGGYFDRAHLDALTKQAAYYSSKAESVCITLNPVKPALLAKRANRVARLGKGESTGKEAILRRRLLFIDIDADRAGGVAGISATEEERSGAYKILVALAEYFSKLGWPAPLLVVDSGNGYWLLFLVDEPNDADTDALFTRALEALENKFGATAGANGEIDPSVATANRLIKIPGTLAAKGDEVDGRIHRIATIIEEHPDAAPVTREQIAALAAEAPAQSSTAQAHGTARNGARPRTPRAPTVEEVRAALQHVNSDDRDTWFKTGASLKSAFGEDGRTLWETWSQTSAKYDSQDQDKTWRSLAADDGVTIATLFKFARDGGWNGGYTRGNGKATHVNLTEDAPPIDDGEPPAVGDFNEIALSHAFVEEYGRRNFRYVEKSSTWLKYDEAEARWAEDRKLHRFTLMKRIVISEAHAAPDKSKNALQSAKTVAAALTLAKSHPAVIAVEEQFDADNWLLNMPGAVLELRTGSIRPGRRADYFTKVTPVAAREMPTPIFDRFMREIMGSLVPLDICVCAACLQADAKGEQRTPAAHDEEVTRLVTYLERLYAYCLTGDVTEHLLIFEVGDGGNGKGLLNDVMSRHVMGTYPKGYACEIPMEALIESKGERHPTELMDLWHSRLALARESEEGTVWNEGRVKRLSGEDRVKARRMRQDYVEFNPTHKQIVFGQAKPKLRGSDQAAWKRRLHMINFPQKWDREVDPSKNVLVEDRDLLNKLAQEAPGILYKLSRALLDYLREGFDVPETVRASSAQYLEAQNTVLHWIAEEADTTNPHEVSTVKELWRSFTKWAETQHERIGDRNSFIDSLERAGFTIYRTMKARGLVRSIKLRALD